MKSKNKTAEITTRLEAVIDQVGDVIDKLHTPIKAIDFSETLSDNSIEEIRLHLGYTKNYSDLAKTRLHYTRALENGI